MFILTDIFHSAFWCSKYFIFMVIFEFLDPRNIDLDPNINVLCRIELKIYHNIDFRGHFEYRPLVELAHTFKKNLFFWVNLQESAFKPYSRKISHELSWWVLY